MEEEWLDGYVKNISDESTTDSISQLTQPTQTVVALTNVQSSNTTPQAAKSMTPNRTFFCSENILRPPLAISPANSTASSEVSSGVRSGHSLTKTANKRKLNNDDTYSDAINKIVDTLQQPVVIKSPDTAANNLSCNASDLVNACMAFIGSLLKDIKHKVLKLDVMHVLIKTVINASTQDLESTSHI